MFERDWITCLDYDTILGSLVNIIEGGGGEYVWPLNDHKVLHYNNEWDIDIIKAIATLTNDLFHILGEVGYKNK